MITNKTGDKVKVFYNKNPFPGPYTASSVESYPGRNRYISFISKNIKHSSMVLDAGCGTGFITNFLAQQHPGTKFIGVDFSNSVDHANKIRRELGTGNIKFVKKDLIKFKTKKKFDAIICQGVLHHIPDHKQALANLKNMLTSGGLFIIGLYHPWGKALQKLLPNDYTSRTLEVDQEQHPFELSFWRKDVKSMFRGYKYITSHPGVFLNWRNGGLTTYIFRKEDQDV
jgi:2-polyprenyl-3-methyl-5-hydroxy-6-metoxy-1,4-benzoquinol methylase